MKVTFNPKNTDETAKVLEIVALFRDTSTPACDQTTKVDETTHDSLGMEWNGEIHASTKALNADGTWKARKGRAEEHARAVEAHKVHEPRKGIPCTIAPEAHDNIMTLPENPNPEIPARPITYTEVSQRFMGLMTTGKITNYHEVYTAAGVIEARDLETNESLRRALWDQLDLIENV